MNETDLLNSSLNLTGNLTQNETVKQAAAQGGAWSFDLVKSVDLLLNNELSNGVAAIVNHTFSTNIASGPLLVGLVIIGTAWMKWRWFVQVIGTVGSYLLLTAAGYLVLKGLGVL